MRAVDIIRKKRDGGELLQAEIEAFATAAAHGSDWEEYQLSALLMAIYWRGMTPTETAQLTAAMTHSGKRYRWDHIPGVKVDKHSTGGVGDKTSLILAPLAAACGVIVPMMSGRGLGHTGGTLDKLEAIPGFRVNLNEAELEDTLRTLGVGMIGQTPEVAPADKKLYSLRDVTATVESIPLITASILSKKLAEGIDALVMDVKAGRGAFMKTHADAQALARSIVAVGNANGVRTEALITSMEVPLGYAIGNSLETMECIETLKGNGPPDLEELSVLLAAKMVRLAGQANSEADAIVRVQQALRSGQGLEKWRQIVQLQGGDPRTLDDYNRFPTAPHRYTIKADRRGYIIDLHAEEIGIGSMKLGAGRRSAKDTVDHAVGVVIRTPWGAEVSAGTPILEVHYRDERTLAAALPHLVGAIQLGDAPPTRRPLVLETIG